MASIAYRFFIAGHVSRKASCNTGFLTRSRLSTHAYPREIEFVKELPKTPSGKLQRFLLRQRAEEESV